MTAMCMRASRSFLMAMGQPPDRTLGSIVSVEVAVKESFCYTAGMGGAMTRAAPPGRVAWLSDLIRLEIALWNRIDARLKREHHLPLASFEALYAVGRSREGGPRVGELARALRVTVGGTSKLVDRVEAAGLLRREAVAGDRRASRLVLTDAGQRALAAASRTYEAELAAVLDAALGAAEQRRLHDLVRRLLATMDEGDPP
jgi:DNA-binding MarR family transcriptional regulator